jgi:hypothetical protein
MKNRLKTGMLILSLAVLSGNGWAQQEVLRSPAYTFAKRYFAELLSKQTKQEQLNLLSEDMLILKINGRDWKESRIALASILPEINADTPLSIRESEKEFQFIWLVNEDRQTVEFRFPKQYNLILGKDKKELTQSFQSDLEAFQWEGAVKIIPREGNTTDSLNGVYADLGDIYMIPQMKSGQYIQRKGDRQDFVLNERMGIESLLNLFTNADVMNRKNELNVNVRGYNTNDTFDYTLDRLCAYMKAQNCTAYVGLETEDDKEYTGTVFYVNRELMYKHLVYFRFPKTAFMREQEKVNIKVYPYIPINNIADLYEDAPKEMN